MRTIIAGSRGIENYAMLAAAIRHLPWKPTLILSGGAVGVDTMGERWAKENGIGVEVFQADWEGLGRRAGFARNEDMAKRAEALLALWDGKSTGTRHMISIAGMHGLKVVVFRADRPWEPLRAKMDVRPVEGEPEAFVTCSCGREFSVDAVVGDNLYDYRNELVEFCPRCGALNEAKVGE
jgi:hypothetical protein